MVSTTGFKCDQVVATLRKRIISGEYPLGSRLPTCKELTKLYQVSYMTAYKALVQLERDGYITLKKHVGSTVSYIQDAPLPRCKSLNLITSNAYSLPLTKAFLDEGQRFFSEAGWEVATYRIPYGKTLPDDGLLAVNSQEAYSLFFDLHTVFQNTAASLDHFYERAIYLGEYIPNPRLTTITCDEPATVRTVLEHFRSQGRHRTGIIQYHLDNVTELQRITAWSSEMMASGASLQWCNDHVFFCDLKWDDSSSKWMRNSFRQLQARNFLAEIDSLFVPIPQHAAVLADLCQKNGIEIPQDLSIVTLGSEADLSTLKPAVPYIDNGMQHHMALALEVLESRLCGQRTPQRLFTFHPTLHLPDSTPVLK